MLWNLTSVSAILLLRYDYSNYHYRDCNTLGDLLPDNNFARRAPGCLNLLNVFWVANICQETCKTTVAPHNVGTNTYKMHGSRMLELLISTHTCIYPVHNIYIYIYIHSMTVSIEQSFHARPPRDCHRYFTHGRPVHHPGLLCSILHIPVFLDKTIHKCMGVHAQGKVHGTQKIHGLGDY